METDFQRLMNREVKRIQDFMDELDIPTHDEKGTLLLSERVRLAVKLASIEKSDPCLSGGDT
jgi:hypothetical protein